MTHSEKVIEDLIAENDWLQMEKQHCFWKGWMTGAFWVSIGWGVMFYVYTVV